MAVEMHLSPLYKRQYRENPIINNVPYREAVLSARMHVYTNLSLPVDPLLTACNHFNASPGIIPIGLLDD